ncbi:unnamed protein product [Mytilus coruscus]|uniref:Uncharacterized protein n=1 Tax=Mytilus coruscus TaxID=42192 RepID=A0A6J8B2X5_MYTCO|nr:unnamed protein product [Mytilus coruscus]
MDSVKEFDVLLKAFRILEKEHNLGTKKETTSEKKSPIKPKHQITIENKQIQQLTARINQLTTSSYETNHQEFYERNLQDTTLKPINHFLKIECADGQPLPYMGYVEADLQLAGSSRFKSYTGLFLVVPNSPYHKTVPLQPTLNALHNDIPQAARPKVIPARRENNKPANTSNKSTGIPQKNSDQQQITKFTTIQSSSQHQSHGTPVKPTTSSGLEKSPVTPTEKLHDGTANNSTERSRTTKKM